MSPCKASTLFVYDTQEEQKIAKQQKAGFSKHADFISVCQVLWYWAPRSSYICFRIASFSCKKTSARRKGGGGGLENKFRSKRLLCTERVFPLLFFSPHSRSSHHSFDLEARNTYISFGRHCDWVLLFSLLSICCLFFFWPTVRSAWWNKMERKKHTHWKVSSSMAGGHLWWY